MSVNYLKRMETFRYTSRPNRAVVPVQQPELEQQLREFRQLQKLLAPLAKHLHQRCKQLGCSWNQIP